MIEAALGHLEGGGHVEDLRAVLDGDDATIGEVAAVEAAIYLVDDRRGAVATPQEVGVHGVHHALDHRGGGRRQRLAQHLAAENLRAADVAALTAEQVVLQLLQLQQLQQVGQALVHELTRGRRITA